MTVGIRSSTLGDIHSHNQQKHQQAAERIAQYLKRQIRLTKVGKYKRLLAETLQECLAKIQVEDPAFAIKVHKILTNAAQRANEAKQPRHKTKAAIYFSLFSEPQQDTNPLNGTDLSAFDQLIADCMAIYSPTTAVTARDPNQGHRVSRLFRMSRVLPTQAFEQDSDYTPPRP